MNRSTRKIPAQKKTTLALMIDGQTHRRAGKAWEDFYDCVVARSREGGPRESLASVKKRLMGRKRQR